jgi:hypothetical protein
LSDCGLLPPGSGARRRERQGDPPPWGTPMVFSDDAWNELSDENKRIVRDLAVEDGR